MSNSKSSKIITKDSCGKIHFISDNCEFNESLDDMIESSYLNKKYQNELDSFSFLKRKRLLTNDRPFNYESIKKKVKLTHSSNDNSNHFMEDFNEFQDNNIISNSDIEINIQTKKKSNNESQEIFESNSQKFMLFEE